MHRDMYSLNFAINNCFNEIIVHIDDGDGDKLL